jgi:hypothetical protein
MFKAQHSYSHAVTYIWPAPDWNVTVTTGWIRPNCNKLKQATHSVHRHSRICTEDKGDDFKCLLYIYQ